MSALGTSWLPGNCALMLLMAPLGRDVGIDVDQRLDVGVAGCGIADYEPSVGLSDKHDRAGHGLEIAVQVGRIGVRAANGFGGTSTVYPAACKRVTTSSQLEPSAHAPCSNTMVGLGFWLVLRAATALGMIDTATAARPATEL